MYKLCKTEQSAKRQREIEDCLLEMMRVKNFEDITVTELCERTGIPRKAFYRYFDNKDDILTAMIDHRLSDYNGFSVDRSNETRRVLLTEIEEYFIFWVDNRDLLTTLDKSNLLGILTQRIMNYPLQDRIITAKFLPNDTDKTREMVFKFALSGLMNIMIYYWYKNGFKESTREMAEVACRLLNEPLFPNLAELGFQ